MHFLLPQLIGLLHKHDEAVMFKPEFFERRRSGAVGHTFVQVKPIAKFKDDIKLFYNCGTRPNGVDKARWPEDLSVEVVA